MATSTSNNTKQAILVITLLLAALLTDGGARATAPLKTIVVDHYYPYTFVNEQGEVAGFSVDLIRVAAKEMGLDVEFQVDTWQNAQKALAGGAIDFLPMMAFSEERDQSFDFSPPHTIAFDAVFARKNSPPIRSLAELQGKKIIVMKDDRAHEYLKRLPFIAQGQLVFSNNLEETLTMLDQGQNDAALMPKLVGLSLIDKLGLKNVEVEPFLIEEYQRPFSIAVKKGDFELLERLNQGVSILKTTKAYGTIYDRWFGRYTSSPWGIPAPYRRYLLWSLAGLAVGGTILLLWNVALRRQVEQRTGELRREIEERKRAKIKLQESHALLTAVMDGAADAIFVKDLDGRYLLANPSTCLAIGKPVAEIIGRSDRELFPSASATEINAVDSQVLASGKKILAEEHLQTAYGDSYWLASKTPLRNHEGTISGLIGISRNITDLKTSQKSLQESEARFRKAITSAPFPIMIHDECGQVLQLSNAWSELSGYPLEEIPTVAAWSEKAFGAARREEMIAKIGALFALQERKDSGEFPVRTKDGRIVIWDFSSAPLGENAEGRKIVISMAKDVTERKKAEQERQEFEARLLQAEKMEAIGTLAGGIAHDFNNILSVIIGYTEMAKDDSPADSEMNNELDQVLIAAQRAKELVGQILAFSRQKIAEYILFQPASIVKEALKLLRASIPSTIDIRTAINPLTSVILADPTQINQIVINLCTNAYHAMEQQGGVLTVSLQNKELHPDDLLDEPAVPPGDFIELYIEDTGVGIDPMIKAKIFDPYFTTKKFGKGTGMGLAIVHGLVKSYGGLIKVESRVGEGTKVTVYLPVATTTPPPEKQASTAILTGSEEILLVDDEETLLAMGHSMLTRLGYQVTTSSNGVEALALFRKQPDRFKVIITDQTMPAMTGADLASQVLKIRPQQPIILCTGYSTVINEEEAKGLGIKEFALKPLVTSEIAGLIRRLLDRSEIATQLAG